MGCSDSTEGGGGTPELDALVAFDVPYSGKVWRIYFFKHLAKKFGALIDQPKGHCCKYLFG